MLLQDAGPLVDVSGARLAAERTAAVDACVRALAAPVPERCAVVAVGGYGRRQLAPGSDVDLLFVHDPSAEAPAVERLANAVLYPMWDAGFRISHATLTPEECGDRAAADLASLTAGLDARLVSGSPALARAVRGASSSVADRDPGRVVNLLTTSRRERAERFGNLGTALEPDLRDSIGALRDVHVLRWCRALEVAPPGSSGRPPPDPPVAGFDPEAATGEALDFLILVRHALHRATGGSSNRLGADVHHTVAELLGIDGHAAWEPRDRLVREVALRGRWVQLVFAVATGVWPSLVAAAHNVVDGAARFDPERPDPAGLAEWAGSLRPATWGLGRRAWVARMLTEPPEMLDALDASGLMGALFREWDDVRARPQRDPYHRSHVDSHLLAALGQARRLIINPPDDITARAVTRVRDPQAVLLGALLHDIGKVGARAHVERGVRIAERVTDRMGLPADRREAVVFLVREHLLLSDSATRRNLDDEDLVLRIAGAIGDRDRLGMLTVLTLADAFATGPAASSPWRLALIFELVAKVGRAFDHHQMDSDRGMRLALAERTLRAALRSEDAGEVDSFLASVPSAYLLWVPPDRAVAHLRLVRPPLGPDDVRVHVEGSQDGFDDLTVAARDRRGLLAKVAGSLALSGLTILTARAFTTRDGLALDAFHVRGAFETPVDPHRWRRFEDTLRGALGGDLDLGEGVAALRGHYRPSRSSVPVSAHGIEERSDFFTVVEVQAADRLGLLFDLANVLAGHGLDVHFARVATYGPRVIDVFYLTDREGQRLEDPSALGLVCRELEAAAAEGRPGSGSRVDSRGFRRSQRRPGAPSVRPGSVPPPSPRA